jgi:hypothetical protein
MGLFAEVGLLNILPIEIVYLKVDFGYDAQDFMIL